MHRGFTTSLLCLMNYFRIIKKERYDCVRKQKKFPKILGETDSVWLLLILSGTFLSHLNFAYVLFISGSEVLWVEWRVMSFDCEKLIQRLCSWIWLLKIISLKNLSCGTVLTSLQDFLLFAILLFSEFARSCASKNDRCVEVELRTYR